MTNLNWLHLSDLHRGMTSQAWLWSNVESAFFEDLGKLHDRCGPWHIIFFTGDLTQKGKKHEYEKLNETLGRLYKRLEKLGSNPVLLVVPGNHDLARPKPNEPAVKLLENWDNDSEMQEEFWSDSNSLYRRQLRKVFANYEKWLETHPFPKPDDFKKGLITGDFAATIVRGEIKVGVVGLNVTFLQLTNAQYVNKLAVSARQLAGVCGEHYDDWFKERDISFLLTHQPPSWLNTSSRIVLEREIHTPNRFIAHLYGHMHEHKTYADSRGGAKPRHYWQAPSAFGLEYFGNNECRQHGYTAGRIEFDAKGAQVRLWPRIAVPHQAGHLHIVRDPSSSLDVDGSPSVGPVYINRLTASNPNQIRSPFSILLLATDTDLRDAREATALHLRKSLGISVTVASGDDLIDEPDFDHIFLVQGWWWAEGKAARQWLRAPDFKRTAMLITKNGDWPPFRLIELTATTEIEAFRAGVEKPTYFDDPRELPEKVSQVVTALVQSMSGDERLGLLDWERTYMDFRLPAWRAGRTASPGHLLEAEGTEELYQSDLYVTLEGTARKWHRGLDGRPKLIRKQPKKSAQEIASERVESRVPLGRWLSVPHLPRLTLVGAPGGGKTIFLTRTAAAIANACLGRPGELEPDIEMDCLRHQSGILPIPVVLEATRIANRDSLDATALIEAMADEMAVTDKLTRRTAEIKQGLKRGRYLLLIDALDEIADSARRTSVLNLLKGLAAPAVFPKTRLILTTRSARYTGSLKFGPELETVEVAPLSDVQVSQLCRNWSSHRGRDDSYFEQLMNAVASLADQVGSSTDDQSLTENPLMLTAICMVFERYRSLPDDRGRLCELLIDDLCRSRNSEDVEHGWKLDDATKKDLLQRIALAMQEEGSQTWPVSRAIQIASTLVPTGDILSHQRAKKYLDWAADHTGLLRFQEAPRGEEHIRFWHRLFREYLAAARLAQLDKTASDMIDELWCRKRLENPFWEDVIRLLPRPLGTIEKAKSLRERLEELADANPLHKPRLLGLATAGIIENRDLFPDVDFPAKALQLREIYQAEGEHWEMEDKVLFLEGLGRLDPRRGDPRFHEDRWFAVPSGKVRLPVQRQLQEMYGYPLLKPESQDVEPFAITWAPVTVQEYQTFIKSEGFQNKEHSSPEYVNSAPLAARKPLSERIRQQLRHPNWPVVLISFSEAEAFCRWRTTQRSDRQVVRLPSEAEVVLLRNLRSSTSTHLEEHMFSGPHLGPIGLRTAPNAEVVDLWGTLWQWCSVSPRKRQANKVLTQYTSHPLAFGLSGPDGFGYAPDEKSFVHDTLGFRCVLAPLNP
jgi:predicted MPP superfamily phosphohydrolase